MTSLMTYFRQRHCLCLLKVLSVLAVVVPLYLYIGNSFDRQNRFGLGLQSFSVSHQTARSRQGQAGRDTTHGRPACTMETCFDYSPCSRESGFSVFLYEGLGKEGEGGEGEGSAVLSAVRESLRVKGYLTPDPHRACLFLLLLGDRRQDSVARATLRDDLRALPHWGEEGSNHVLMSVFGVEEGGGGGSEERGEGGADCCEGEDTGKALLVQPTFRASFRPFYDIIAPPGNGSEVDDEAQWWAGSPPIHPARRRYLLTFWAQYIPLPAHTSGDGHREFPDYIPPPATTSGDGHREFPDSNPQTVAEELQELGARCGDCRVQLTCAADGPLGQPTEWGLCSTRESRAVNLSQSTFALIVSPADQHLLTSWTFQTRLREALRHGAVPVVVGHMGRQLPFGELLDWERAVVILPLARTRDLPDLLSALPDSRVFQLRLQGRLLYHTYLRSAQRVVDTALAVVRARLRLPPAPAREEPSVPYVVLSPRPFNLSQQADPKRTKPDRYEEDFGRWTFNRPGDPFSLFPASPFHPVLTSEVKFIDNSYGQKGEKTGSGGFSTKLGGNRPAENFTVVIVTYKREQSLMAALRRLRGLPFLDKAVVIWNDPTAPSAQLTWPDIGVPLVVLKAERNSMNNRYLPYDCIQTEAVLNLDDDVDLHHDSILLAFGVWRDMRDRIVGFFSRYHYWSQKRRRWEYTWHRWETALHGVPEYSFIIPSTSFLHKYYFHLFSDVMPKVIRDTVDKTMNCEDIAMNFLVAHVTRKPPVKVVSKWKRSCPGCRSSISGSAGHLQKRHDCLNIFASVYGYMPLVFSRFTAHPVVNMS